MECDLVVLGSGPGGYPAAIRAAQLGASVVVVEEATQVGGESAVVGGTCLNVGCIPTKAMVQSAHAYNDAQGHFAQLGVRLGNVDLDFEQVQSNRRGIVDGVVKGLAGLLKGNGIKVVQGRGRFTGPNTLAVEGGEDIHVQERRDRDRLAPGGAADPRHRPPALHRLDRRARAGRRAAAPGRARRRRDRRRVRVDLRAVRLGRDGRRDAAQPDRQRGRRRGGRRCSARSAAAASPSSSARARPASRRPTATSRCATRPPRARTRLLEADVILVATGRVANVEDVGLEAAGVDRRARVASPSTPTCARTSRTSTPRATSRATGSSPTRPSARARSRPRTRSGTPPRSTTARRRAASTPIPRSRRSACPRPRRASCTAIRSWPGRCPTRRSPARRCTATARAS